MVSCFIIYKCFFLEKTYKKDIVMLMISVLTQKKSVRVFVAL